MMRSLYTAASGMLAQQFNMDTISNNLANVNTMGFRKSAARFQDLLYQELRSPGSPVGASVVPTGQEVGLGVKIGSAEKLFTQGTLIATNNGLDMAIQGDGFFQVTQQDGTIAYTRDGSFKRDANGAMVTADGFFLSPQITIPQNALTVSVGQDGTVSALLPGQQAPQNLGQINLVRFTNAAGLNPLGRNLLSQSAASGPPIIATPGLNGTGSIQGGYLENSNVQVVEEIVNMIVAQRAFEANSKAITVSDEMLAAAVNTKR